MTFWISKYEDKMLCDVVPMQVGHLLLTKPLQFNRRVKNDGLTNKYSFVFNQRNMTLIQLTPKQVYGDQVSVQRESEQKKNEREKVKKSTTIERKS